MNHLRRPKHPTAIAGFVPRPVLLRSLTSESDNGLTLLTAPGGYGKTWLSAQVARAWSQPLADVGPVRVWTIQSSMSLTQALRSFCELFGRQQVPASLSPEVAVDIAIDALSQSRMAGALVIDIDGAPPNKAVQSLIGRIVLDFAPRGRMLVACRSPWLLPIDRVSLLAPLQILRAQDLAMSAQEIALAQSLDAERAREWQQLTEGWPVICGGSSHWCVSRSATDPQETLVDRLVGMFADYMEHELLAPLPARDVKLLMQVAIFDAIEPGLLEAVELGTPWSRLASLVESGLPLSSNQTDWDRIVIHPIFRRFLQRRMLARTPALHHSLHRRAAHYFAAAGNHSEAMLHAMQTGDAVFRRRSPESSGGWRISWREGLRALTPGSAPPQELSERFPKAALARIYWQAQTGRIDDARAALERLHAQQPWPALRSDLLAVDAVISIYCDADFDEARQRQLGDLRSEAAEDEPMMFPGGATLQAAMLNNAGLYDRGALAARTAIVEAEALGSRYIEFYGQLQHGLALHGLGRIGDAVPCYLRARLLAQDIFGDSSGEGRLIGLLIAHAAWLAGQDEQLERADDDLDGLYRLHAWLDPYAHALQIAQVIGRKRGGKALEDRVLEDFAGLAARRKLPRLQALVALGRAQQALAEGHDDLAERACDAALQIMARPDAADPIITARVLAPAWLEKARIALARGAFDDAARALARLRECKAGLCDGALNMESGLLEAYVALRGRRYREVSQLLTQCVLDAELTGLRRPFLQHAALIMELVEYAGNHALNLDVRILQRAAEFARKGCADGVAGAGRQPPGRGGLLLTERETDILHFLAEGLSSKEMARRLSISEATIKTHRKHLYEKLNAGLRSQALVKARELGLL